MSVSLSDFETKVKNLFKEHAKSGIAYFFFRPYLMTSSEECEKKTIIFTANELVEIFTSVPQNLQESAFSIVISHRVLSNSANKIVDLFVRDVTQRQMLSIKCICEKLLTCAELNINSCGWNDTFAFFMENISLLDYKDLLNPQMRLLTHVFMHYTYRDAIAVLLGTAKPEKSRIPYFEEVITEIILELMFTAECDHSQLNPQAWRIISTQIIYLTLQQSICFTRLVKILHTKLTHYPYRYARNQLMWCLFNFLSGGMQKYSGKNAWPSPALVETYCRMLTYADLEILGLKQFTSHIVLTAARHQCCEMMYICCEILNYRLFNIPSTYRVHAIAPFARLLNSFVAVAADGTRQSIAENEELMRIIILTLARSTVISSMLGPRKVLIHLKSLADFLVYETNSADVNRCVDVLNRLIFKYAVVPLERFMLTMLLRDYEGNDAFYALLIVMLLVQRSEELRSAVADCVAMLPSDYWHCQDWNDKYQAYQLKHAERTWSQVHTELSRASLTPNDCPLPVYFGTRCLQMLPVVDLLLQKLVESPAACLKFLDSTLSILGPLYRFHPYPVSFLYSTFRFYEKRLVEAPAIKQKLALAVHGACVPSRDDHWLLSAEFVSCVGSGPVTDRGPWVPDLNYYATLVRRLMDTFSEPRQQWSRKSDLRFVEFNNFQTHALYCICIELMSLSVSVVDVGNALITLAQFGRQKYRHISYMEPFYQTILTTLCSDHMNSMNTDVSNKLDFEKRSKLMEDCYPARILALCHAVWLHSASGYLQLLPQALRSTWIPHVRSEGQFLYVCHLVAPFLQRFYQERTKFTMDITTDLYQMLYNVDCEVSSWNYEDLICDFFYHVKYMYVGDSVRQETDRIIPMLRTSLQQKLRYISFAQGEQSGTPFSEMINPIKFLGIQMVVWLQRLPIFGETAQHFWLAVTKLGDPVMTFSLYFPALFPFFGTAAVDMVAQVVMRWFRLRDFSGLCWLLYVVFLIAVSISRTYISAHFPDQVILGIVVGICIALVTRSLVGHRRRQWSNLIAFMIVLLLIALSVHEAHRFLGVDTHRSIELAAKYCHRAEWIHQSTTPLASFFRDVGVLISIAVLLANKSMLTNNNNNNSTSKPFSSKFAQALLGVGLNQLCKHLLFCC
ncbi:Mediator of RNA polymerase II transcription subunit 23 [Trichinella pseudospiralis]|uniref:Mediator of RNA polymerase II transcription subunit 23 n=1 Tax=Trichinella pseudospiralis TaxID=6337 RepID=A0A0V0XKC4_TRIPS|nr:Mediator of RNA polymerase II transcription subunit 23 [Trichinella pseudospiralis]